MFLESLSFDMFVHDVFLETVMCFFDDDDGTPMGIIVKKVRKGSEMASTG